MILRPRTQRPLSELNRLVSKLRRGDVLIVDRWYITIVADSEQDSFWLEGHGEVFKVPRTSKTGAALRKLIYHVESVRFAAERPANA